jgi:hypothetical protein
MQLPWDEHFFEIVLPAWRAYLRAEANVVETKGAADNRLDYDALREAGAACLYVHHFGEIVLRAKPAWLPRRVTNIVALRTWLTSHCTMLRTPNPSKDVYLLAQVSNALKHAILTRSAQDVSANEQVLVLTSGYGELPYGEGHYGGGKQVLVLAKSGTRALSSVLQNVLDAWHRGAGLRLPA